MSSPHSCQRRIGTAKAASQMPMRVINAPPRARDNFCLQLRAGPVNVERHFPAAPTAFRYEAVGPENEIGMALPDFELVFLRRVYRPADDLKDIRGSAAVAVLHAHGNSDDYGSAEFASGVRRNRRNESAVREASRANFDGFEQAWKRATRADGIHEIALREHHGFAGG